MIDKDNMTHKEKVNLIKRIAREKALDWLEENKPIVVPHLVVALRGWSAFATEDANDLDFAVKIDQHQMRSYQQWKTYENGDRDFINAEVCGIPNDRRDYNIFRLGCYFPTEEDADQFTEEIADELKDLDLDWLLDEVDLLDCCD